MFSTLQFSTVSQDALKRFQAWKRLVRKPTLAVQKQMSLSSSAQLLTVGSCFVNEIRAVLERSDLVVHPLIDPELSELFVDEVKSNPAWGQWDERVHYQFFTPFTIRQEIEVALKTREQNPDAVLKRRFKGRDVFIDPYRRSVYAKSHQDVLTLRTRMNEQLRKGLEVSELVVMTLGLTEAFRMPRYDLFVSEYSRIIGDEELEFVNGTHDQIASELDQTIGLIRSVFPQKKIVLTVSPIPIARTFSGTDAITATLRGKSILRASIDTLTQRYDNLYYWPSYEYVMFSEGSFRSDDLRHVRPETVAEITQAFCKAFFNQSVSSKILRVESRHGSSRKPISGAFSMLRSSLRRSA
ncbi:MAG: GSCFA domain-containing protein [Planctomycetota bacterium]